MAIYETPKIGSKLSNGATVLNVRRQSLNPLDNYLCFVLCDFNGQFVTWGHNLQDGGCFWGHYFGKDEVKAEKDFRVRSI